MWRHAPDRAVWQWLIDGVPVAETSWMMLISADRGDMHRHLALIEAGLPPGTPMGIVQFAVQEGS